ncbi:FHA domain-containing protein [Peredibacter starrii]|uniref:FHA domain-containing protein n=1 Tax=Peredibacter starrii TaxID=28202 RepID=A0AAX4HTR2_9BACT|nr:FHA domain-containing protein [Peredibacter starrii]WPU66376.1 FHA domain-containing protein [Peredibacter starrii]
MLAKLFRRKSVPTNDGELSGSVAPRLRFKKVFELQLTNMEDSPVYDLTHQLTIGSEIGNIVIADPSISPRHATFILQQEVISVIDHGSVSGTFVNGNKIPPGKYIILEESDVLKIGDLEIKIITKNISEEIEEVEEAIEETIADEPEEIDKKKFNVKKQAKVISIDAPNYATNSLVRLAAVIGDFLLAYSLLVVLQPFDEVRNFLDFIPSFALSLVDADWQGMWEAFIADYGFVGAMAEDAFAFFSNTLNPGPLVLMFMLVRLISTLIFGVSISELLLGVGSKGNILWRRIGGGLRVLVGMITGPFLVFDLPAVISRRTLKEFLTFTHTYLISKLWAVLGSIVILPLLLALALVAPLFQGFELPRAIEINERVDQRVKVKNQPESAATFTPVEDASQSLDLALTYNPDELVIIPHFKFHGVRNKIALKNGLQFYQKDQLATVGFEVFKNFDLKELLGIGMKGNVFLYDKFPQIYNFVYSAEDSNPAFKAKENQVTQLSFANEMIEFIKMSFALDAENALEKMQTETFFIKGLIDFKASFLSLLEYKDFDKIGFIKIGNTIFMKISFNKQRPFDLLMPLMKGEGRIFKVNFEKKENLEAVATKFYKYNLEKSNWNPDIKRGESEGMTALQVLDLFSTPKLKDIQPEKAQSLYGYYFETSSAILGHGDPVLVEVWKRNVSSLIQLLEALPAANTSESIQKLQQNFKDLLDALETKNMEYFGVSHSASV